MTIDYFHKQLILLKYINKSGTLREDTQVEIYCVKNFK